MEIRFVERGPALRLKEARIDAGYASAAAFAQAHGLTESSYRSHENGSRGITRQIAQRYAQILGGSVTWEWLLFGYTEELVTTARQPVRRFPRRRDDRDAQSWAIEELDVRDGAGNSTVHEVTDAKQVAEWHVPGVLLRGKTTATPNQIKIITVYGDSMVPDFIPGERLMVDTQDRSPSPSGIFVIWDGFGLVVKRVEMVPYSDPPKVRLISRNKEYSTLELPAEEVHINGRVIGKWLWT